jgi:hypothetical protein
MVMLSDLIRNGSLITLPNFLHNYEELDSKKESYQYQATHQPKLVQYGNRFQSTPCWETENLKDIDNPMHISIKKQLELLFGQEIIEFHCRIRCTKSSELKKSPQYKDNNIGMIHADEDNIAGVLPFDQSFTGGTAFFSHSWDKVPDITHGAWPNRLILYNGKRNHAACQDFTFENRYMLILFFNLA